MVLTDDDDDDEARWYGNLHLHHHVLDILLEGPVTCYVSPSSMVINIDYLTEIYLLVTLEKKNGARLQWLYII